MATWFVRHQLLPLAAGEPAPVAAAPAAGAAPAPPPPPAPSGRRARRRALDTGRATGAPGPAPRPAPASTHRSHAAVLALVDRAQAGDAGAFAQLYDLHWHLIHTYFRYHLNGPVGERTELAEDLTADVFVKALEKLPSYRPSGAPFSAWLYRIAHNHLIDTVRAQKRRPGVSLDASDEFAGLEDPEAAQHLDAALAHQQIAEALAALTADQHEVIVHRFMHDRTITETARRMAKHPDAVKQLQLRALQRMRRALGAP